MRFIWAVARLEDTQWAHPYLGDGCEVYVTSSQGLREPSKAKKKNWSTHGDEAIELQEREGLMEDVDGSSSSSAAFPHVPPPSDTNLPSNVILSDGRPNLSLIVSQIFNPHPNSGSDAPSKIAVLVCGPAGMGVALRREVGVYVRKGRVDVWWHNEEFGW